MAILLSKSDVAELLGMQAEIDILEAAFSDLSNEKAIMPQRTPILVDNHSGLGLFMPAYLKGVGAFGAKIVTVYKDNPAKYDMPTVLGTILILDEKTGQALSVMEGGYLTAMRTGGVCGLATKHLARKEARVHTMFGTGGMATAHAWAVDAAADIETLVLYSLDEPDKKQAFAESLKKKLDCKIEIADDPKDAIGKADIVTLITSAKDPIVEGSWFKPGTHINASGAHAPTMRELDPATLNRSKIVCDLIDACKAEAGDFLIPAESGEWSWEKIHGNLGDVITRKIAGRESDDEITLFKSVGLAIQDISTADYVYNKAKEEGVGVSFNF